MVMCTCVSRSLTNLTQSSVHRSGCEFLTKIRKCQAEQVPFCRVRAATADALGRNQATQIQITGPSEGRSEPSAGTCAVETDPDGKSKLTW